MTLNRFWAYSLLKRMNFVKWKVKIAKSKHAVAEFQRLKEEFLQYVVTTVEMEEIPSELILNWDQTDRSNIWDVAHARDKIIVHTMP